MSEELAAWQRCWRGGLADLLPTKGLVALREALIVDSRRLVQEVTAIDGDGEGYDPYVVAACCPLAYCGWKTGEVISIEDAIAYVDVLRQRQKRRSKDGSGVRDFIQWVDSTPRKQMRRELLAEVTRTLIERGVECGKLATCLA